MKRRYFLQSSSAIGIGLWLPILGCSDPKANAEAHSSEYQVLAENLLADWCDAMLKLQIHKPEDEKLHGALDCPACNKIHGRCMDAVYPFMYMADKTGEQKYMDGAIAVMEWSKNVSMPDGSWTVIPNPKSWRGISVFGAIALAEALHHHGHILPEDIHQKWKARLAKVGEYIFKNFDMTFTNINYGFTSVYALNLMGHVLENDTYLERSRTLAKEIKNWFTSPNYLIFGETKKPSTRKSDKGLSGVDLGYNVEETLNGVVQYAVLEKDEELLKLLTKSLEGHLHFMLPDGAWDNSWGTRQFKWSYWGSRTTDGCQPAFALMSERNPAFGTAAYKSTELLKRCTADGLIHGGLHYTTHGIKPCVHHTFAHAKALATILNEKEAIVKVDKKAPLPRSIADGVKEFPEVSVWLAARGDWRATVSSYDHIYRENVLHGTGGALNVLYHNKVGALFTASMAKYMLVEKNNQQPQPNEDFALTPRLETFSEGKWYTNIYDLKAKVEFSDEQGLIQFDVRADLVDENQASPRGQQLPVELSYLIDKETISIKCKNANKETQNFPVRLVLPMVSPTGESVTQPSPNIIKIQKPDGLVIIEANVPLQIKETTKERVFNMVPGMEAVPIIVDMPKEGVKDVVCTIKVV